MDTFDHDADMDTHERIRWARIRWQMSQGITPEMGAAADSLGMKQHTYRAYEREPGSSKHTKLDLPRAMMFGRKYKVSWHWLLTGEGSPDDEALTPHQLRVVQAMRKAGDDKQEAVAVAIEQLLKIG
ncbi:MAG: hypothetical protein WAW13_00645 [Minisyncoccia bacterium]